MEEQNNQNTTTMRDYLQILFRHKAVIIVSFVTVMLTVAVGLKLKTPVYESRVKMLISAEKQIESLYYRDLTGARSAEVVLTQSEIVKSNPIIERVVRVTGLFNRPLDYEKKFASSLKKALIDSKTKKFNKKLDALPEGQKKAFLFRLAVEDLKKNIKVEPIRDTNLFLISAKEFSPIGAAIIANVVSRSYVIFDLEQQLAELELKYGKKHLSVKQLKDNIDKMIESLNGEPLPNIEAIGPASVKIIEQAQIPLRPTGTSKRITFLLALIMAPFLGIMLAFVFEYMDQTFKTPRDIETFLNSPFLGAIPKKKKFKAEALCNLSDQVYLLAKDKNLKSLLFTSALPKEGVSVITANLARNLSEKAGHKLLIIDANLRNPSIHKAFKISEGLGLADILEGKIAFDKAVRDLGDNLSVLPSGKTGLNPVILLGSERMAEIIKLAREKYELILVDCSNLKDFKDSIVVSSCLEGVCLVVNEGKTRRQVVKAAIGPLEQKKVSIIGVVMNNRTFAIPKLVYDRI